MHLKELVLEGFKSYAQKTVIRPFDKHFNAITGLNGSGKSNILDSLIFLLGITGYRDLRASDSKDLIYKQGSAGITTATVTGVFDNSDPLRSPQGYQHAKSITVSRTILPTGQSKYSINGTKCTQTQVQEMFQSVQLNVLNPHFIIMQGKIAKVSNLKPGELLKLIEEATGTTMYESKRDLALKGMEKRAVTLQQATEMFKAIKERKDKLASDVKKYQEFTYLKSKVKIFEKQLVAISFIQLRSILDKIIADKTRYEGEQQRLEMDIVNANVEIKTFEAQKVEMEKEIAKSSAGQQAQNALTTAEKNEAVCRGELDQLRNDKNNAVQKEASLKNKIVGLKQQNDELQTALEGCQTAWEQAQTIEQEAQEYIDTLTNSLTGLGSTSGGQGGGLAGAAAFQEKKNSEENSIRQNETSLHLAKGAVRLLQDTIQDEKSRQKSEKVQFEQAQRDIDELQLNIQTIEDKITSQAREACAQTNIALANRPLGSLHPDELNQHRDMSLENCLTILNQQGISLRNKIAALHDQALQLRQRASNPLSRPEWFNVSRNMGVFDALNKSGIDPRRLHGLVVNLLDVTTDPQQWGLALEVAAGGKIFQVCCDSYDIGSQLLKNNQGFGSAINIISLDRIQFSVQMGKIQEVKQRYQQGNRAFLASDIVAARPNAPQGFDRVIQMIFGNVFLCSDSIVAKEIANMGVRAVAVNGDQYEPGGTITGGSTGGMNWLREYLHAHHFIDDAITMETLYQEYELLDQRIISLVGDVQRLRQQQFDLKTKMERVKRGGYQRSLDSIARTEGELNAKLEEIKSLEARIVKSNELIKDYTEKITAMADVNEGEKRKKNLKVELTNKEREFANLRANTRKARTTLNTVTTDLKDIQDNLQQVEDEYQEHKEYLVRLGEQIDTKLIKLTELSEKTAFAKQQYDEIIARSAEIKTKLKRLTDEIARLHEQKNVKIGQIKQFSDMVNAKTEEHTKTQSEVAKMLKSHPWIRAEESDFNVAGGNYDFSSDDATVERYEEQLQRAQHQLQVLKRYDDPLIVDQLDQLQREYTDKQTKLKSVKVERDSIEKSIEILDKKRIETVENTFRVVDKYFGLIFAILLPGAQSRLKPHRVGGQDDGELIGAEMQVAFNGKWKESLSELSGGQRSLLALSLILALLRCKPAPLYILDEVDAALDASHTQNIGKTIKEHFQQSQFIIVSLKEGMFENANVLIRTQLGPNGSALSVTKRNND